MGLFAALFTAVRADSSPMGGELGFCVYAVTHRDVLLLSLGDEGFVLYIYIFWRWAWGGRLWRKWVLGAACAILSMAGRKAELP